MRTDLLQQRCRREESTIEVKRHPVEWNAVSCCSEPYRSTVVYRVLYRGRSFPWNGVPTFMRGMCSIHRQGHTCIACRGFLTLCSSPIVLFTYSVENGASLSISRSQAVQFLSHAVKSSGFIFESFAGEGKEDFRFLGRRFWSHFAVCDPPVPPPPPSPPVPP